MKKDTSLPIKAQKKGLSDKPISPKSLLVSWNPRPHLARGNRYSVEFPPPPTSPLFLQTVFTNLIPSFTTKPQKGLMEGGPEDTKIKTHLQLGEGVPFCTYGIKKGY